MNLEQFEMVIHRKIIVDQVASFLYAIKMVPSNHEIIDIEFYNTVDNLTRIKVITKKE